MPRWSKLTPLAAGVACYAVLQPLFEVMLESVFMMPSMVGAPRARRDRGLAVDGLGVDPVSGEVGGTLRVLSSSLLVTLVAAVGCPALIAMARVRAKRRQRATGPAAVLLVPTAVAMLELSPPPRAAEVATLMCATKQPLDELVAYEVDEDFLFVATVLVKEGGQYPRARISRKLRRHFESDGQRIKTKIKAWIKDERCPIFLSSEAFGPSGKGKRYLLCIHPLAARLQNIVDEFALKNEARLSGFREHDGMVGLLCDGATEYDVSRGTQTHVEHLQTLTEMEWAEEKRIVNQRLEHWPLERLVSHGFAVTGLDFHIEGKFFGQACVHFSFSDGGMLPPHEFSAGDEVVVRREDVLDKRWKAVVVSVTHVKIACSMEIVPERGGRWRLDRGANRIAYERAKEALSRFAKKKNINVAAVLLGMSSLEACHLHLGLDTTDLNASQLVAAKTVESQRVALIQGPPGCGKTTVACRILKAAYRDKPLLATADSHAAVDQLARGLRSLGVRVLRSGSPAAVSDELHESTYDTQWERHPATESLQRLEQDVQELQKLRRDLNKLFREPVCHQSRNLPSSVDDAEEEIRVIEAKIAALQRQIRKAKFRVDDSIFAEAEVVCATLVTCGSSLLGGRRFDLILLDEATQATEPRTLIATNMLSPSGRLVAVGDQQQLPPTCISREAEAKGLGLSLFCRLIRAGIATPVMLREQYRMHPILSCWPSKTFYDGQLLDADGTSMQSPPPGLLWPLAGGLAFFRSEAPEVASVDGQSKENPGESQLVMQVLVSLLRHPHGIETADVGVISPYKGQVRRLRRDLHQRWPEIEVKTVDGFQGREKQVIVVSCVRSNSRGSVGFLSDYRRMNVAFTRARSGLVVIGNPSTLSHDRVWSQWLGFVAQHQLEVDASSLRLRSV